MIAIAQNATTVAPPRPATLTSDSRRKAAWSILIEATTVDVVRALTTNDIPHIALKGPLLQARLFPEGDDHRSSDVDVLVAPHMWAEAENELARLGFEPLLLDVIPGDRPNHARPYARRVGGPSVDLHRTLLGAEAPATVLWNELEKETETVTIGDATVTVLNPSGQLLHMALHAAQNGAEDARTLRYLERCIELSDDDEAREALRIARAIEADEAFSLGLSLVVPGRELNGKLDISPQPSVLASLRATSAPNTAHALEWFASRPDIRTRARFVWHKIVPPAAFMLSSYPFARTRRGLLIAYPARWMWLAGQLGPSWRAWREARRISRPPSHRAMTSQAVRRVLLDLLSAGRESVYHSHSLRFVRRPLRLAHRFSRYCRVFGFIAGTRLCCQELAGRKTSIATTGKNAPYANLGVRLGTTDISVFSKVFLEKEYDVQLRRNPETIIDAGAYTGYSTVFLAHRFPAATIVALEPDLANFRLLQAHVAELPNVIAVHAALWSANEPVVVDDPGWGAWGYRVRAAEPAGEQVEGLTITEVMQRFGFGRVGLFKIDIEGSEAEIFRSPEGWLDRVDAIMVETHDDIVSGCDAAVRSAVASFDLRLAGHETLLCERRP